MRRGLVDEGAATLRMKQDMGNDNFNMYDLIAYQVKALDLYLPHVWEYPRLNVTNNVMSKWKLNRLVPDGWVDGWDDPRLITLAGLRRRGASPEAIQAFCHGVGITQTWRMLEREAEDSKLEVEFMLQCDSSLN